MMIFRFLALGLATFVPIISAADPLIDLAVDIGGGKVQRLQLYEGNNIENSVNAFIQKFDLPASSKTLLISSVQQQADAIFQANQAAAKQKQAAAAAAAAAAQPKPITFDISITVPLQYTPGTDINIAARAFCDRHGLDPAATVPAIIDLARQQLAAKNQAAAAAKAAAEQAAAEKAAAEKAAAEQAAAQAAAAARKLVATLPLNIAGKQVSVQLYEGDRVDNVASNVCQSLGLSAADYHQPLVDAIANMVRKLGQ